MKSDLEPAITGNGDIPQGYVRLDVNLVAVTGKVFLTRAAADPLMSHIDDVHLMIFQDTDNDGVIADADPLVMRNFYEYGVKQNIYLKKSDRYFIYVVANLADSNCPNGDAAAFFDDIATYGDLKRKHVQFLMRSPRELGKMIMSTQDIIPISFTSQEEIFAPTIPLQRLQSKFIVTIYNRVASANNHAVTSGVYPSTLSAVDLPRFSYMLQHSVADNTDGKHDYPFTLSDISEGYYESVAEFLPETEGVFEYPEGSGRWYTRQTVEFFSFENRRGSNPEINSYDKDGNGPVQNVYGRKALAPDYSTYLRLTSLTRGNALLTYVHAGKGRDSEAIAPDDIANFDVDRSCVYHFNIVINGVDNVEIDTRRYYLDQVITFTLPDVSRIDAHYIDIPSFILGTVTGYAKIQSGTCDVSVNGNIIYDGLEPRNLRLMSNSDPDAERWLRFSWGDPYRPLPTPINTSLYVRLTEVDAFSGATPIIHFNEYVDDLQRAAVPAVNPPRRTAVIKVGFVAGALSSAEYDEGVAMGMESAFYVPVSQYGLKTIGQVGGYKDGVYTSLLGVESVEEYKMQYYNRPGYLQDVINNGPYWQYRSGLVNHNQAYDGLRATKDHYNDYRSQFAGGVPPKRWDNVTIPEAGMYNPQSNTNAADYCMRKNRDEDGNGIIEGDEVKWYLPTPVQVMQMYTWRDAFRNGSYSLNVGYTPFATSYWTTNEDATTPPYNNAYVVDFSSTSTVVMASTASKTTRNSVRCVRDIPGQQQSMFYYSNGHLAVDLTGTFPNLDDRKYGKKENDLRDPQYNTLARTFLVSRWYAPNNNNNPAQDYGNNNLCDNYSEVGYTSGWFLPSQQELSFIYAYAGIIENVFEQSLGTPNTAATYHTFRLGPHWAITNIGSNNTFWKVDFTTGAAGIYSKNGSTAYFRCVTYLTNPLPR